MLNRFNVGWDVNAALEQANSFPFDQQLTVARFKWQSIQSTNSFN